MAKSAGIVTQVMSPLNRLWGKIGFRGMGAKYMLSTLSIIVLLKAFAEDQWDMVDEKLTEGAEFLSDKFGG